MAQATPLDPTDKRILAMLQEDGRMRNTELADALRMTPAPCLRRVKALEEGGVIRKYVALVEPRLVGRSLSAIVEIKLTSQTREKIEAFEKAIAKLPEILECYLVTGDWDFVMKIIVADLEAFQKFLVDRLTALPEVQSLKSTIIVRAAKYTTALAIG